MIYFILIPIVLYAAWRLVSVGNEFDGAFDDGDEQ